MFSIVVPLYNKERFVFGAINSVIQQTYEDFELIIIDDGSTDRSPEIVRGIRDSRIRLVSQDNRGVGPARNRGVEESRYEIVAFLDADDIFLPYHLEELNKLIDIFPNSPLYSTRRAEVNMNSVDHWISNHKDVANAERRLYDYLGEWRIGCGYVHPSCVAVRRQVFLDGERFNNYSPGQDINLWIRMSLVSNFAISSRITAVYVKGTGGIVDQNEINKGDNTILDLYQKKICVMKPILTAREDINYKEKWRAIDRFQEVYLRNVIMMSLVRGDFGVCRAILNNFKRFELLETRVIKLLLYVPDSMLYFIIRTYRCFKFLVRKLKANRL